jgi:hypothetical protein
MSNPPARYIPGELHSEYTMNNSIHVFDWYCDNRFSETLNWTPEFINRYIQRFTPHNIVHNFEINMPYPEGEPYINGSLFNLNAIIKYRAHIQNKDVAVIGSLTPWLEAIIINMGAKSVTTVEYNKPKSTDIIKTVTYDDFVISNEKYDAIFSYSSIEHAGLGRYGDPLKPNGDIETMQHIHNKLNFNGLALIGIPIGKDSIVWNAHRIYGPIRLTKLFSNFKELDWVGYDKSYLDICPLENIGPQPVIVLQKV